MKHVATEGFILKKRDYRESDEIITMFTREFGKVRIFAKGIKKITSRRSPHIQTGNYLSCILTKRDDLFFLHETSLRSGLSLVKDYHGSINYLYQFFFILDRLLPEQEPEEQVYQALTAFCKELSFNRQFSQQEMNQYIREILVVLGHGYDETEDSRIVAFAEKVMQEKVPLHVII